MMTRMWRGASFAACCVVLSATQCRAGSDPWPQYCSAKAEIDTTYGGQVTTGHGTIKPFAERRIIPKAEAEFEGAQPKLVMVVTRHGARTPAGNNHVCWPGYKPKWDCPAQHEFVKSFQLEKAADDAAQSNDFRVSYESNFGENTLEGTCSLGQLVKEGAEQHQTLGEILAKAYFGGDTSVGQDEVFTNPLVDKSTLRVDGKDFGDMMYFRTTDKQRTRMSGANLVSSLMKSVGAEDDAKPPVMRTVDSKREILDWNVFDFEYARSAEYAEYRKEQAVMRKKLLGQLNAAEADIKAPLWEDAKLTIYVKDCVFAHVCYGKRENLGQTESNIVTTYFDPKGKPDERRESYEFIQELYKWAGEDIMFPFKYNGGSDAMSTEKGFHLMVKEFRLNILKELCDTSPQEVWLQKQCSKVQMPAAYSESDGHLKELYEKHESRKFMLYSTHDTTIMGLFQALGIFKDEWPGLASMFTFEVVEKEDEKTKDKTMYFRFVWDMMNDDSKLQILTKRFGGCVDNFCKLEKFFEATEWADAKYVDRKFGK